MILERLGKGYCKKKRVLKFLAKIFGWVASAPLRDIPKKYKMKFYKRDWILTNAHYASHELFASSAL